MREAEKRGFRIHDTAAAHDFLSAYAKSKEEDAGGCLGKWSPYKIANFKMELIGANEIPRPRVDLTGIPGSSKLYQFMGAENQEQRLRSSLGVEPADSGVVVVAGNEHANPGPEVVGPAPRPEKVTRKYTCRVRKASCYCSKCRVGSYPDCMVAKNYPEIVGKVHEKSGKDRLVPAADS
ncbi:unnamed protein product [Ectocarpus sp. CCAP 1310/34]|nr:unnamed protein product [Ectocarpus sp. CCAP 1310/34]